jgi:hypothetical protein
MCVRPVVCTTTRSNWRMNSVPVQACTTNTWASSLSRWVGTLTDVNYLASAHDVFQQVSTTFSTCVRLFSKCARLFSKCVCCETMGTLFFQNNHTTKNDQLIAHTPLDITTQAQPHNHTHARTLKPVPSYTHNHTQSPKTKCTHAHACKISTIHRLAY